MTIGVSPAGSSAVQNSNPFQARKKEVETSGAIAQNTKGPNGVETSGSVACLFSGFNSGAGSSGNTLCVA